MSFSQDGTAASAPPTWDRFATRPRVLDGSTRLLLVLAPKGSGRMRFARHWLRTLGGGILEYSPPANRHHAELVASIHSRLQNDARLRIALVALPDQDWSELQDRIDCETVELAELLLDRAEVGTWLAARRGGLEDASLPTADALYDLAGGWRNALEALDNRALIALSSRTGAPLPDAATLDLPGHGINADGPGAAAASTTAAASTAAASTSTRRSAARRPPVAATALPTDPVEAVATGLRTWLRAADPDRRLARMAFLPVLDDSVWRMLADGGQAPPSCRELQAAGLAVTGLDGNVRTPKVIRQAVVRSLRTAHDAGQDHAWVRMVLDAGIAAGHGREVLDAVEEHHWWKPLLDVLAAGRWAELLAQNPVRLRRAMERAPRALLRESSLAAVGVELLAALMGGVDLVAGGHGTGEGYREDAAAARLTELAEGLAHQADGLALTVGLVEVYTLRHRGHVKEAADRAAALRPVIRAADDSAAASRLLCGMVEGECALQLLLAGRDREAFEAFRSCLSYGLRGNAPQVTSAAAAHLALITAMDGDSEQTRQWLRLYGLQAALLPWGEPVMGRAARLARAQLAFEALDIEELGRILAELPPLPDHHTLWPAHASLAARHQVLTGSPMGGYGLISSLQQARKSAANPLAVRLLEAAKWFAALSAGRFDPPRLRPEELGAEGPLLDIWLKAATGDLEAATARARALAWQEGASARSRFGARVMQIALEGHRELPPEVLRELAGNHRSGGALIDLLGLWQTPAHRGAVGDALGLAPEERARLDAIWYTRWRGQSPRPQLTTRELAVLAGIARGLGRAELAAQEHVSVNTVKAQAASLYRKLGVSSREEAVQAAREWGFL
ncbi:LuxR C-terminal-related transcriptional regulator [Zafaria sp. Z1313]|uniref:LuxR C-terminal-related transcriptional regulator n=1 Tax=Zafaria sp. Z1313 TaxID=3423202 RepID=UPI003D301A52